MMKRCTKCDRELPNTREFFHYERRDLEQLRARCIECVCAYTRQHQPPKGRPATARQLAREAGEVVYHGAPCRRCGSTLKRTSEARCAACLPKVQQMKRARFSEERKRLISMRSSLRQKLVRIKDPETARTIGRLNRAKRRARQRMAMPPWFSEWDRFVCAEAAHLAARRTSLTGIKWAVDHMIPLSGTSACGLHVGANMQVIPATLNNRKQNRMILTLPGEWIGHL